MTSPFSDLVTERSILVCCGSGGVGKTTSAATLALEAARLVDQVETVVEAP